MIWWKRIALVVMVGLVAAGHVALWADPEWSRAAKLRLTVLNALGWGIVILPALGVVMWARAHRTSEGDPDRTEPPRPGSR